MGLVKTRRLAAMQKQQRAKAGMMLPCKNLKVLVPRTKFLSGPRRPYDWVMGNEVSVGRGFDPNEILQGIVIDRMKWYDRT